MQKLLLHPMTRLFKCTINWRSSHTAEAAQNVGEVSTLYGCTFKWFMVVSIQSHFDTSQFDTNWSCFDPSTKSIPFNQLTVLNIPTFIFSNINDPTNVFLFFSDNVTAILNVSNIRTQPLRLLIKIRNQGCQKGRVAGQNMYSRLVSYP